MNELNIQYYPPLSDMSHTITHIFPQALLLSIYISYLWSGNHWLSMSHNNTLITMTACQRSYFVRCNNSSKSYISCFQIELCKHIVLNSCSCRGYLNKMGARFKSWNKRWFVFDRNKRTLVYYADKSEVIWNRKYFSKSLIMITQQNEIKQSCWAQENGLVVDGNPSIWIADPSMWKLLNIQLYLAEVYEQMFSEWLARLKRDFSSLCIPHLTPYIMRFSQTHLS